MKTRIIINIEDIDDKTATERVLYVINSGKISTNQWGKQYCFAQTFTDGTKVFADQRKSGTNVFYVYKDKTVERQGDISSSDGKNGNKN